MKAIIALSTCISAICLSLQADECTVQLCNKLGIYPGSKAKIQWERIFSDEKKMQQYKINTLSDDAKSKLKLYLIKHAADSEQPMVPGL
ncbi:MAG: hypothetical protein AB7S65_05645 [Sulfuricurvum sp.]